MISFCVMLCCYVVMLCHVMLCLLCYIMLCYVMLCYVMYVMLYFDVKYITNCDRFLIYSSIDLLWRFIFFQGIPGNGKFKNTTQLVDTLTPIIFLSTVENAAVNLPVYDECAFIPNYPMILRGRPPTSKVYTLYIYKKLSFGPVLNFRSFSWCQN